MRRCLQRSVGEWLSLFSMNLLLYLLILICSKILLCFAIVWFDISQNCFCFTFVSNFSKEKEVCAF